MSLVKEIKVLANDLAIQRGNGNFTIPPIQIEKGPARAIHPSELEKRKGYYQRLYDSSRDHNTALEQRILRPMEEGLLIVKNPDGSIKFDDRKLRVDKVKKTEDGYFIYLAPTHYGEVLASNVRAIKNKEWHRTLRHEGLWHHNDPEAFFANNLTVCTSMVSKEGYVLLFLTTPNNTYYPEHWHVGGGQYDTEFEEFDQKDPSQYFLEKLKHTAKKEVKEEVGIDVAPVLTGIVDGLSAVDATFFGKTDTDMKKIEEAWKTAKDRSEASKYLVLEGPQAIVDFLRDQGAKIFPASIVNLMLYLRTLEDGTFYKQTLEIDYDFWHGWSMEHSHQGIK